MGSKKYKFLINSLHHCFICFEEIQTDPANISLWKFLHYLKINLQELQSLSKKPSSLLNQTDIQVSLCKDCERVLQKFTKIYNELQVIQLKLNSTLEDISVLLGNKNTSKKEYLCKLQAPGNDRALKHSQILEDILSSMRKKCHRILEIAMPRVELERLKLSDKVKPDQGISGDSSGILIRVVKVESNYEKNYSPIHSQSPVPEEFTAETVEYFDNLNLTSTVDPLAPDDIKLTKKKFRKNCKGKALLSNSCPLCKKKFYSNFNLKRHLRTHSEEKAFKCQLCSKAYRTAEGLAYHQGNIHSILSDVHRDRKCGLKKKRKHKGHFVCKFCSKVYTTWNCYTGHLKLHTGSVQAVSILLFPWHTGNAHKCHVCNRNFPQLYNLKAHLAVHSKESRFKCTKCGMKFKFKNKLKEHFKSMHMSEFNAVC